MKRVVSMLALAALPCFAQVASEPTISADAALDIAAAALRHCRAEGQKVSVTVVDAAGRVKASVRDDGAAPHTAEHSMRKAYTALSYKMPSAEYGKRAQEAKGIAIGPQLLPNITTAAGGIPIRSGGAVIGAVGVSGTPGSAGGGEHDAKCAEAGLAKVFTAKQARAANPVERNPVAMEKAARAGDAESAYELGKVYEYGLLGATQDEARSAQWYRTAAEMGHRLAQFEASVGYYKGQGVAQDKVEAAKWWTLAMANGASVPEWMRVSVESAEAKLTPGEIAEGRRRAREWLAKK
jgi:uncharacterized protein GlcG (DUF336 family)